MDSITVNPIIPTSYTVTGTTAGCSSSKVGTITTLPIPNINVNSETICIGDTKTLTASGATSFLWSTGASTNFISDKPTATTIYTVTGTSAVCSASTTATITVNQFPSVGVNSTTICQGLSTILTATGADMYLWSDNTNQNPRTITTSTPLTYTVTVIFYALN